jgi:hypothetical protein
MLRILGSLPKECQAAKRPFRLIRSANVPAGREFRGVPHCFPHPEVQFDTCIPKQTS